MNKRQFITLVGGAAAAWPFPTWAQQSERVRRIGVLMGYAESDLEVQSHIAAFRDRLQKLGWTEGSRYFPPFALAENMATDFCRGQRKRASCLPRE